MALSYAPRAQRLSLRFTHNVTQ
ncbi:uncharacterized protein G2W53_019960 [Senna tora]|uniref:Uncharacterized protein n=1 Tax=Senna tora TaxID=362788 RepID=A0A834TY29_9FABA|nr:uncharacterized protein G2W53_019960 [Senna tora]